MTCLAYEAEAKAEAEAEAEAGRKSLLNSTASGFSHEGNSAAFYGSFGRREEKVY